MRLSDLKGGSMEFTGEYLLRVWSGMKKYGMKMLKFRVRLEVYDVRDFQKLSVGVTYIEVVKDSLKYKNEKLHRVMSIQKFERLRRKVEQLGEEYHEAEYEAKEAYLSQLHEQAKVEDWKRFPPIEERARMAGRPVWKQERIERRERERQETLKRLMPD
jgi:hypothetical protein